MDLVWPAGFSARFAPNLELLDPSGAVVGRQGDLIDDAGGGTAGGNVTYVCELHGQVYN